MITKPPQRKSTPPPPRSQQSTAKVVLGNLDAKSSKGHRVTLYGTGGIGKTTLACCAPGPVAFIDVDESLETLKGQLEENGIPLPRPVAVDSWQGVRTALQSAGWDSIKTIVIDTATKLEELAVVQTLRMVKHTDKGTAVSSVEGYGFGKGFQFVFDTFLPILGDLDRHVRAGRNVILIAHECTSNVPNPRGEDWLRYEPRLQDPKSGKASIRLRMKEWSDHVLFLGYDVNVSKEGKAEGAGTRTLYTAERPFCMAKSRTTGGVSFDVTLGDGSIDAIWPAIIK